MRILYLVERPNSPSESYIRTEYEWALGRGHGLLVLATDRPVWAEEYVEASRMAPTNAPVAEIARTFRPDVVHCWWLRTFERYRPDLETLGVPVVVRAHDPPSFKVSTAAASPVVRAVLATPAEARAADLPKVRGVPACWPPAFSEALPAPARSGVARAGAALPGKALEEFCEVARLCPEVEFTLALARSVGPARGYLDEVRALAPPNVVVVEDLRRGEVAALYARTFVFCKGWGPRSGEEPVSVIEALASGCLPVLGGAPAAREQAAECGLYYSDPAGAAEIVRALHRAPAAQVDLGRRLCRARAELCRAEVILPAVEEAWREAADWGVRS